MKRYLLILLVTERHRVHEGAVPMVNDVLGSYDSIADAHSTARIRSWQYYAIYDTEADIVRNYEE